MKITDCTTYEQLVTFVDEKGYSNDALHSKRYWFNVRNDGKYDLIITLLDILLKQRAKSHNIPDDTVVAYYKEFGGTGAARKLQEDFGIKITRQTVHNIVRRVV